MNRAPMRLLGLALLAVAACERPPVDSVQLGYRGVGLEHVSNPRILEKKVAERTPPAPLPAAPAEAPAAPGTYQNVQVLTDLSPAEFARTMLAMTAWVSPKQGCAYCHNVANMASDEVYQKVVSRKMLQMTRAINSGYTNHVAQTGVTCYTCHMGNPVPTAPWYYTDRQQVLRHFLDRNDVRVVSQAMTPVAANNRSSIQQTEYTYSLMLHVSRSLGVNCTYCHNSRVWYEWSESAPQRLTALRGIAMVRDLNNQYMLPLQDVWPAEPRLTREDLDQYGGLHAERASTTARLGPMGDGPKIQCSTCHNAAYKPLYGAQMAKHYPGLYQPKVIVMPDTAAAPGDTLNAGQ